MWIECRFHLCCCLARDPSPLNHFNSGSTSVHCAVVIYLAWQKVANKLCSNILESVLLQKISPNQWHSQIKGIFISFPMDFCLVFNAVARDIFCVLWGEVCFKFKFYRQGPSWKWSELHSKSCYPLWDLTDICSDVTEGVEFLCLNW